MKKQWIAAMGIAALIGVIVYACSKEEGNVQIVTTSTSQPTTPTKPATSTPDLQLVSPHGHRVAETIDQLKEELAVFLSEQYGEAVQPEEVLVATVNYIGEGEVEAAVITGSTSDRPFSILRIVSVGNKKKIYQDGNIIKIVPIDIDEEEPSCPNIPRDFLCFGDCGRPNDGLGGGCETCCKWKCLKGDLDAYLGYPIVYAGQVAFACACGEPYEWELGIQPANCWVFRKMPH